MREETSWRALARRIKALLWDHPNTLTSLNNLAPVLRHQRKYELAEKVNRRALMMDEKVTGVECSDN